MPTTIGVSEVSGEADNTPSRILDQMRALIIGGNAQLFRYSQADEKALSLLGDYVVAEDTLYSWPNQPAGSVVDTAYAKLYAETALLQYFRDNTSSGATIAAVSGYSERIRSASITFKSNTFQGVSYPRSGDFYDRDCQIGDIVDLSGVVDDTTYTLRTSIRGFLGDTVAASVDSASASSGNAADGSEASAVVQTAGDYTGVHLEIDPTSTYDGLADGVVRETYVVTVLQGSGGHDDLTYARLRVVSSSGTDDQSSVTPGDTGIPFAIGTRGLRAYFDYLWQDSLSSEVSEGIDVDDLVAGQTWVITVEQDFAAATATSGGTYSGTSDTTYIVTVSKGGTFTVGDYPQIAVSTANGTDAAVPINVTALSTAFAVGNTGVTITFADATYGLRKGDVFYIPVLAAGEGPIHTLLLDHSLSAGLRAATDLDLSLSIEQTDKLVPLQSEQTDGEYNYSVSATGITVNPAIYLTDASLTDSGVLVPVPVTEATLYAEYRAWLSGSISQIGTVSSAVEVAALPGATHPDNPLKWGVHKAWLASNTSSVKYLAVADPSVTANWQTALDRISGKTGFHGVVPMTDSTTILDLFATHVADQSDELIGNYRALWCCPTVAATAVLLDDQVAGDTPMATIEADPDAVGTPYTLVRFASGTPDLRLLGLRSGDSLYTNYQTDAWGTEVYDEYLIDSVVSADAVKLQAGPSAAIVEAVKTEIWRNRTNADIVDTRIGQQEAYASTRVRVVWPDTVSDGVYTYAGYFAAAELAGLRSGAAPNRSLTNVLLASITSVPRTDMLTDVQCQALVDGGGWVLQADNDGNIVTRRGMTSTGSSDLLYQEEMAVANVDSIHGVYRSDLADMLGSYNVTTAAIEQIRLTLLGSISYLQETRNASLGPQLISAEIASVTRMTLLLDHLSINMTETVPLPLNQVVIQSELVA